MKFYSRGKFLITGEYLVMKGASALAAPLKMGQTLAIDSIEENGIIHWTSKEHGKNWFDCTIDFSLFEVLTSSDNRTAQFLVRLLKSASELNSGFPEGKKGYRVTTDLEFNLNWGFGSSSSLISNVAYWAKVDPFDLHRKVSEGSGYDVVCARSNQPLIFSLKNKRYEVEHVRFAPGFSDQVYFIYLGSKQDSSESVRSFLEKETTDQGLINDISALSYSMARTENIDTFNDCIREHDIIMSKLLMQPRLKESRFSELEGEIKPLGAWGGDFAMLTWKESRTGLINYLKQKDISVIFSFNEILKTS
jgi:mevalonate kinase